MRLPRVRLTVRRMTLALAVIAPLLAVAVWLNQIGRALDEMYGPGGVQDRQRRFQAEVRAGADDLRQGRYLEAERRYRAALALVGSRFQYVAVAPAYIGDEVTASLGLADAIAGRGLYPEVGLLHRKAYSKRRNTFGANHPAVIEVSDRQEAALRLTGREAEAVEFAAKRGAR